MNKKIRLISILTALLLVLPTLICGCGTESGDTSSEGEQSVNTESTDVSAEASQTEEPSSEEEISEEVSKSGDKVMKTVCISNGKKYKTSLASSQTYPDVYGTGLTDGLLAPREGVTYTEQRSFGYEAGSSSPFTITVDFEEVVDGVKRFEVDYLCANEAGVGAPRSVTVKYSEDGKIWSISHTCTLPEYSERTMQTAFFELEETVSCQYVRFSVIGGAHWTFLDEVAVYAEREVDDTEKVKADEIEKQYGEETLTSDERAKLLEKVKTGDADKTKERIEIGATYKASKTPLSQYADTTARKLCDGTTGTRLEDGTWVGYDAEGGLEIVLTLDSEHTDVAAFELHVCGVEAIKAAYPDCVTVYVSNDKNDWTEVGRTYATTKEQETFGFVLELPCTVKAKYVKFVLSETESEIFLIDEAAAYYYGEKVDDSAVYPPVSFPEVTERVYWSKDEADYSKETDLIKGLGQQISCPAGFSVDDKSSNSSASLGLLTNGLYAPDTNIHDGAYFKFNAGGGRNIYYDIGRISALTSFEVSFIYYPSWGVYVPNTVTVMLSNDAKDWYVVGGMTINGTKDGEKVVGKLTLDSPVAARFICYSFPVSGWAGIDEILANGTKEVPSGTKYIEEMGLEKRNLTGSSETEGWANADPSLLGGVKDVFLAYHGKSSAWTADQLYSEIAYVDADGKALDTMFDGILFLMGGMFPSGLGGGTGGVLNYNRTDADWLVETLFKKDQNIMALEEATGKLKKELSLPDDYKVKFFVSLYYPSCGSFGDIDGDGVSETTSTNEGRSKILKWWIDMYEKELAKHTFENITFGGFYWYNESIKSDEKPMLNAVADCVHGYGSQFFWIPYYSASGIAEWKSFGFDTACLQPNFAFHLDVPASRVISASATADLLGLSIEIEMDGKVTTDPRYRLHYYEYLKQGAKLGFMKNAMHLYYMGTNPYVLAKSASPDIRLIYDYTYQFIKGTIKTSPDKLDDIAFEAKTNKPASGKLINDELPHGFVLVTPPSHGTVTLNDDGSFDYYPDKDYSGTDVFTFRYSNLMDFSDIVSVNITVG